MRRRRRRGFLTVVFVIVIAAGAFIAIRATSGPSLTPAQIAARAAAARFRRLTGEEKKALHVADATLSVALPTTSQQPAPDSPARVYKTALPKHLVIGFVPYYTLGELSTSDYADASELSYFGIQLNRGGSFALPTGFVPLDTSAFQDFVASAHSANDAVLLTISAFTKPVIDTIARHPQDVAARINSEVAPLVSVYGLQGVDLDIEGRWASDRDGYTTFVRDFAKDFRAGAPKRTIILDTFPQSAAYAQSFYNFKKLQPLVNDFFIMAYAMENADNASANSPAISPDLGLSSVQALLQFTKVVAPQKLVLGLPFYGFDFSTASGRLRGAMTISPDPEAVTYSAVLGVGRPALWDPSSETAYTVFKEGAQWHETWFDDPVSIALKVALANEFHLAGTGVWALGMEGSDTQMLTAIDGDALPVKFPTATS